LLDDTRKGVSEKILKDTGERVICNMNFRNYLVKLPLLAKDIKLIPSDDLRELRWVAITALTSVKLPPPSIELFKKLGYLV
jgi:hypothetical protein